MDQLYRLVYTSFRKPECDEKEIENILKACQRNNPQRKVTGILMHSKNRFIQYIEGNEQDVTALYELIKGDPRHTSVNRRNFEPIDKRMFPSWEMGYKNVDELAFNTAVSGSDKQVFDGLINNELNLDDQGMRILQLFFSMS